MKVCCIITYNDFPLIRDCVESIYNQVDKIIAIDGRYRDFPGDKWKSNDGTFEYLDCKGKVKLISVENCTELDKRNRYLEELNDGDIVLNLDTDEFLVGTIPELKADFGIIDLVCGHSKKPQKRATRFFKYRDGIRYENVHYTLYYGGKQINSLKRLVNKDFTFENISSFYLIHNWHKRSSTRRHHKSKYYKKLVQSERGFPR